MQYDIFIFSLTDPNNLKRHSSYLQQWSDGRMLYRVFDDDNIPQANNAGQAKPQGQGGPHGPIKPTGPDDGSELLFIV